MKGGWEIKNMEGIHAYMTSACVFVCTCMCIYFVCVCVCVCVRVPAYMCMFACAYI